MIAYLINLTQDLTDLAIDINDRVINTFYRKGRKVRDEIQKENGKALNEKVLRFVDLTTILLEAKARGENLDQAIESYISWEQLALERLEEYFVTEEEWVIAKETGTQLAVPLSPEEYLADRKRVLTERLHWLSKNIKSLEGVIKGCFVPSLETEVQAV